MYQLYIDVNKLIDGRYAAYWRMADNFGIARDRVRGISGISLEGFALSKDPQMAVQNAIRQARRRGILDRPIVTLEISASDPVYEYHGCGGLMRAEA